VDLEIVPIHGAKRQILWNRRFRFGAGLRAALGQAEFLVARTGYAVLNEIARTVKVELVVVDMARRMTTVLLDVGGEWL
jgi:hypothetical protein